MKLQCLIILPEPEFLLPLDDPDPVIDAPGFIGFMLPPPGLIGFMLPPGLIGLIDPPVELVK